MDLTINKLKNTAPISILSICNPLIDFLSKVDDKELEKLKVEKGSMNLIEQEQKEKLLAELKNYIMLPGGSCANTLRGFCFLNKDLSLPSPIYFGAIGFDDLGQYYINSLNKIGVKAILKAKNSSSGVSIVFFTPDQERTMLTYLGACRELDKNDIDLSLIKQAQILHLTAYLWNTPQQRELVIKAISLAKQNNTLVSFDLADPFIVKRYHQDLFTWLPGKVDVLLANREELSSFYQTKDEEEILIQAKNHFPALIIMKNGAKGCYLIERKKIFKIEAQKAKALDTTGAGDSFAAGFLYGLLKGQPLQECAQLANKLAGKIVEVVGCDFSQIEWF